MSCVEALHSWWLTFILWQIRFTKSPSPQVQAVCIFVNSGPHWSWTILSHAAWLKEELLAGAHLSLLVSSQCSWQRPRKVLRLNQDSRWSCIFQSSLLNTLGAQCFSLTLASIIPSRVHESQVRIRSQWGTHAGTVHRPRLKRAHKIRTGSEWIFHNPAS